MLVLLLCNLDGYHRLNMINWSKFANPYNNESAQFSDRVYPLNKDNIFDIGKFDHVDRLLNNDLLGNADDRRFAISQAPASHQSYNFYATKVEQIEGAIETLDRYVHLRKPAEERIMPAPSDHHLRQDLAGMASVPVERHTMSELRVSPSPVTWPPPKQSRGTTYSAFTPLSSPSTALTSSHPSTASTAVTSTTATRVSIADLLNDQADARKAVPDGPLSPDPNQTATSHYPEAALNSTLDLIRSTRRIYRPSSGDGAQRRPAWPTNNHHPHQSPFPHGRAFRSARMRRSSKSRESKSEELTTTSLSSPLHHQRPTSPRSSSQALESHGNPQLHQWFDGVLARHPSSPDADDPRKSPRAMQMAGLREISDVQSDTGPRRRGCQSSSDGSDAASEPEGSSDPCNDAYAYTPNQTNAKAPGQTSYGYIAGDARPSLTSLYGSSYAFKVKVRGRARERGKGPRGRVASRETMRDSQNTEPGEPRRSSGIDQQDSQEVKRMVGKKRTRSAGSSPDQSLDDRARITAELVKRWTQIGKDALKEGAHDISPLDELLREDGEHNDEVANKRRKHDSYTKPDSEAEDDAEDLAELEAARALTEKWWKKSRRT